MASPEKALYELLLSLFSSDGRALIRFLRFGEYGEAVAANLPGVEASVATIADRAVVHLKAMGLVGTALFDRLALEFPGRRDDIEAVERRWTPVVQPTGGPVRVALRDAQARKQALETADEPTTAVDAEILQLKREARRGSTLRPGTVLASEYTLLNQVGAGGFGTVWKARSHHSGEFVAIKILHTHEAADTSKRERFFRGARVMQQFNHPTIVKILDPGRTDGEHHFFVMEFVDGINLDRSIRDGVLPSSKVIPVLLEIGRTLAEAHSRGVIHRDVKPSNIILERDGRPRLIDFDLVRALDTTGGTRQGGMGTFVYAAPEMYQDANTADERADVFGLGMTAVFALFGRPLPLEVLRNEKDVFAELDCSAAVKHILARAIRWDAAARYAKMHEFCDVLEEAYERTREPAPPRSLTPRRALTLLAALAGLSFAAVLAWPEQPASTTLGEAVTDTRSRGQQQDAPQPPAVVPVTPGPTEESGDPTIKPPPPKASSTLDRTEIKTTAAGSSPGPAGPETPAKPSKATNTKTFRPPSTAPPAASPAKAEKARMLTAAIISDIARDCNEKDMPGEGCFYTVKVKIQRDATGTIVGASPLGRHASTSMVECVRKALMKTSYTTESTSGAEIEFACEDT